MFRVLQICFLPSEAAKITVDSNPLFQGCARAADGSSLSLFGFSCPGERVSVAVACCCPWRDVLNWCALIVIIRGDYPEWRSIKLDCWVSPRRTCGAPVHTCLIDFPFAGPLVGLGQAFWLGSPWRLARGKTPNETRMESSSLYSPASSLHSNMLPTITRELSRAPTIEGSGFIQKSTRRIHGSTGDQYRYKYVARKHAVLSQIGSFLLRCFAFPLGGSWLLILNVPRTGHPVLDVLRPPTVLA